MAVPIEKPKEIECINVVSTTPDIEPIGHNQSQQHYPDLPMDHIKYPSSLPCDVPQATHIQYYHRQICCDCSPHCLESAYHRTNGSTGSGSDLYKLGHLFNHSVNICSPRIARDDEEHGAEYWNDEKIFAGEKEYMDMDVPLDLSMHKSVR